ncbi:MAG: tautomerase family protein [Firmicutes bacterium]|nr:tautomerase family protein [Bacillota bacterium]
MPYIAIKTYPKDEALKQELVEKINDVVMDVVGCPAEAITISLEEVAPEDWEAKVKKPEIETNLDKMMILSGKRK